MPTITPLAPATPQLAATPTEEVPAAEPLVPLESLKRVQLPNVFEGVPGKPAHIRLSNVPKPILNLSDKSVDNPLFQAMSPAVIDSLFGKPLWSMTRPAEVRVALAQLSDAITSGAFDINAPIVSSGSSSRFAGYPPIAAMVRECNPEAVELLLAIKSVDLGARDNRKQDPIPLRPVLTHAVRGALERSDTVALKMLLVDPRMAEKINYSSQRKGTLEEWSALDFALDALSKDPIREPHLGVARLLASYGAKPLHFQKFVEDHPEILHPTAAE